MASLVSGSCSGFSWAIDHDAVKRELGIVATGLGADHASLDIVHRATGQVLIADDLDGMADNVRRVLAGPSATGTNRHGKPRFNRPITSALVGVLPAHHVIAGLEIVIGWWPA
jgi:hypothetical protein